MAERDGRGEKIEESQNPAFIGQGAGKPEMDRGRGVSEPVASSAAPDDGAACDQLGPITAAALLLCHPARDAGSSSWHKRNNNGDSLPQIFLDTASKRGMTKGVTPHSDAGSRKENLTSKLAGIPWIPHRSAG